MIFGKDSPAPTRARANRGSVKVFYEPPGHLAAKIEGTVESLRDGVDLIGVAAGRKSRKLPAEFVEPARPTRQENRSASIRVVETGNLLTRKQEQEMLKQGRPCCRANRRFLC
jgi:hypothetical protein